jgi:hypothetical protein
MATAFQSNCLVSYFLDEIRKIKFLKMSSFITRGQFPIKNPPSYLNSSLLTRFRGESGNFCSEKKRKRKVILVAIELQKIT